MSLEKPRWKDGPVICEVANLPAFLTVKALEKFYDSICMTARTSWQCSACMRWHAWPLDHNFPARIKKLIRETRYEPNE